MQRRLGFGAVRPESPKDGRTSNNGGALLNTPTASGLTGMDAIRLVFGMELTFDEIEKNTDHLMHACMITQAAIRITIVTSESQNVLSPC
jgi:hypothetical protein